MQVFTFSLWSQSRDRAVGNVYSVMLTYKLLLCKEVVNKLGCLCCLLVGQNTCVPLTLSWGRQPEAHVIEYYLSKSADITRQRVSVKRTVLCRCLLYAPCTRSRFSWQVFRACKLNMTVCTANRFSSRWRVRHLQDAVVNQQARPLCC